MTQPTFFTYVVVRGVRYIRVQDVASFIRKIGETEETDVRNRLDQAAENLITAR
jgi:hypothetical protein